jgi:hypothetical protein
MNARPDLFRPGVFFETASPSPDRPGRRARVRHTSPVSDIFAAMTPPPVGTAARSAGWLMAVLAAAAGCARTLPEQDRRIYGEAPAAKLSTDVLWQDYTTDADAADRQYWGKAIEVSGNITAVTPAPPHVVLTFGQDDQPGVQATLLDDEAEAIASTIKVGDRITLRCYCEGLAEFVRLKSCISRP